MVERGDSLVALEVSTGDSEYAWRTENGDRPFERRTLFTGIPPEKIPPRLLRARLFDALDRLAPDVLAINGYSGRDALACLEWCRSRRRGAVLMTDSKADDAPRHAWREGLKRWIVSHYDAALCAGGPHRDYLLDLGFDSGSVALGYDAVDNAYFAERSRAARASEQAQQLPGLDGTGAFFLASSRFLPRKNLDLLIRAYAEYRRRVPVPWRLVILGDGDERGRLEALVTALGVEEVTFAGFRQIDELPCYYGQAGAFVHPALQDQWGLVVNEAMASGLPVLVSRTAGCARDLVEEECSGLLFDPADGQGLTALLVKLSSDPLLRSRLAAGARRRIADWGLERFCTGLLAASLWAIETARRRRGSGSALAAALRVRDLARKHEAFTRLP